MQKPRSCERRLKGASALQLAQLHLLEPVLLIARQWLPRRSIDCCDQQVESAAFRDGAIDIHLPLCVQSSITVGAATLLLKPDRQRRFATHGKPRSISWRPETGSHPAFAQFATACSSGTRRVRSQQVSQYRCEASIGSGNLSVFDEPLRSIAEGQCGQRLEDFRQLVSHIPVHEIVLIQLRPDGLHRAFAQLGIRSSGVANASTSGAYRPIIRLVLVPSFHLGSP